MELKPAMQALFKELEKLAYEDGKVSLVKISSGVRTCADQERVYKAQGKPFRPCSYHLTGDAFDVILYPVVGEFVVDMAWWPYYRLQTLAKMGAKAEELGFRWGGNFAERDVVHFDDGRRVPVSCCKRGIPVSSGRVVGKRGSQARKRAGDGEKAGCAQRQLCDLEERVTRLNRIVRGLRCEKCRQPFTAAKASGKSGRGRAKRTGSTVVRCGCTPV